MTEMSVPVEIEAVLEHRKASSDCHGAPLDPGAAPETYLCRACGQPCERVLGDPVEVIARG